MSRPRIIIALLIAAATSLTRLGASDGGGERAPNIHQVSTAIFRGSQPDLSQLPKIAALGIRTVVNLRTDDGIEDERNAARAAGLNFIQLGLPAFGRPRDESIKAVLDAITTGQNQPVLVHCNRGADRTGVIVACYRIEYEGWTAEAALSEAKEYGLGWWQRGMKKFIRESCGKAPRGGAPDGGH